jgi:enoyl-CoA hydratase
MAQLEVQRENGVALCTMTNPPAGYMDGATVDELATLTAKLAADDGVRAVVFAGGVDGVFIRHYSVVELEAMARRLRDKGSRFDIERLAPERPIDQVFDRLETMPKPVIAAINGTAMGGGFEFALACDLRLAEEGPYDLGLPEANIGLLPGAGGTQRLARVVGPARALELILRGRTVSPAEALALGMVHEVHPAPVLDRAMALARELAAKPRPAAVHIKRLLRREAHGPLAEGLAVERTLFLDSLVSDDALVRMEQMNRGARDIREP